MPDPFAEEAVDHDFIPPKEYTDLVYSMSRYVKGESPKCIYFPSRKLMFKMMRACIGITKEDDLWFNQHKRNL